MNLNDVEDYHLSARNENSARNIFQNDLSQTLNSSSNQHNSSWSKRPNLFDEKSKSRERIPTKINNQNSDEKNTNTPQFNKKTKLNNESKTKGDSDVLKDFPFLYAQSHTLNESPYQQKPRMTITEEHKALISLTNQRDLSPKRIGQDKMGSLLDNNALNQYNLPPDFFKEVDQLTQSEVSHSPKTGTFMFRNNSFQGSTSNRSHRGNDSETKQQDSSDKKKKAAKDIQKNLNYESNNVALTHHQKSQYESKHRTENLTNTYKSNQLVNIKDLNMDEYIEDNAENPLSKSQDLYDQIRENSNKRENSLIITSKGFNFNRSNEMQGLRFLNNTGNDSIHFQSEGLSYNRKEERVKTQLVQRILDKVLYETVIPNELYQIGKNSVNEIKESFLAPIELYFEEDMVKNVLVQFLGEFLNVTNNKQDSQIALKRYIEEVILENVNFEFCSEIWNNCLLIPQVIKEDPNIFFNSLVASQVVETIVEAIDQEQRSYSQSYEEFQIEQQFFSKTQELPQIQNDELKDSLLEYEISKYLDEKLIFDLLNDQVEELAISELQNLYFQKQKQPQIISDELYNDMIRKQMRLYMQQIIKKERMLQKGAENFLHLFLEQETSELLEEVKTECNEKPLQMIDNAVEEVESIVLQQVFKASIAELEQQIAIKQVCGNLIENQLITIIAEDSHSLIKQLHKDKQMLVKVSDTVISEAIFSLLTNIILNSIQSEKEVHKYANRFTENVQIELIQTIFEECQMEIEKELLQNQKEEAFFRELKSIDDKKSNSSLDDFQDPMNDFDQPVTNTEEAEEEKSSEQKEEDLEKIQQEFFEELDAMSDVGNDIVDNLTREFFFENFDDIKDEYLKSFKEQVKQQEDQILHEQSISILNKTQQINESFYSVRSKAISQTASKMSKAQISFRQRSQLDLHHAAGQSKNTSQFLSVHSDAFYDCNDAEAQEIDKEFMQLQQQQQQQFYQEQQQEQEQIYEDDSQIISQEEEIKQNLSYLSQSNIERLQMQIIHTQVSFRKESAGVPLEETMDIGDIDEGMMEYTGVQNDYVIPQIKSLDFLNLRSTTLNSARTRYSPSKTQDKIHARRADHLLPIDALAIDVLCVNCYECVKFENVDEHSIKCVPGQQKDKSYSPPRFNKDELAKYFQDDQDEIQHQALTLLENEQFDDYYLGFTNSNLKHAKGYNFDEGRYIIENNKNDPKEQQAREEREYIAELNERIFKLHKAIKEKQIEEQSVINQGRGSGDLTFLRNLESLEQLSMQIFTNNTNIREIEILENDLLEQIKTLRPTNGKELSLNITAKRLSQLTLEKIQSIQKYKQLTDSQMARDEAMEIFSHIDDQSRNEFSQMHPGEHEQLGIDDFNPRSFSEVKMRKSQSNFNRFTINNNQLQQTPQAEMRTFIQLEEETKHQKEELEVWRNLHNEILKNYLMTKAQGVNKQIQEITSDVATSKHESLSDNLSSYSSLTGLTSLNHAHFNAFQSPRVQIGTGYQNSRGTESDVAQLEEVEETLRLKQNEDQKRYFYTIAIHSSKKILKTIPQGGILSQLFKKCNVSLLDLLTHFQEARIPMREWEKFIEGELISLKK